MTAPTVAALAPFPPEGAEPTPPGWCACCGCAPGDPYSVHGTAGPERCSHARHAHPEDPATMIERAALHVIVWDLGLSFPAAPMHPAMSARTMALLADTVRVFTARDTR